MGVNIRINKGKIFLDIYVTGHRHWESTGLSVSTDPRQQKEVMKLAEIIRSKRETQIVASKYDLTDPIACRKTLYLYMSEYAKTCSKKHPIHFALKHLEEYPGGTTIKIPEITSSWVDKYRTYLTKDRKLEASTASNYFNSLRQTLNKAVRENIIPKNPATGMHIKQSEPHRIFLSEDELQVLGRTPALEKNTIEVKKAFIFSCYTGLRISDMRTLKWSHLNHTETETILTKRQQKTENNIENPIPVSAWNLINDGNEHPPQDYVFPHLASLKSEDSYTLQKWASQAKISKHISWHVARRTFAMRLLENGTDIYVISKLLGHTNITTTQKYLKMSIKLSKKAINSIGEIKISDSEEHPPSQPIHNQPNNDSETQTSPSPPAENTPCPLPVYNKESDPER
jgi:site-specific recombinase XerD